MNPSTELARIDRTLKSQNEQHKVKLERKKAEMKKLKRQMTQLHKDNQELDTMLEEFHVSVSERRNIQDTHIQV
jgi:cell division protein FtsX